MKIVVFEIEPWEYRAFEALQGEHEVVFEERPLRAEVVERHADAEIVSTFIYSRMSQDVLEKLGHLKLVATRSTGFDHIDLDFCREHGIEVANVPTYGDNTVAEHVFALLLALSHKMVDAVDRTRRGDFSMKGLEGFDLEGRTMGIVGTGNIGRYTARIAKGFGMEVVAYDIAPDHEAAKRIGFAYVDLPELLRRSDVVSLHVRGNEKTRHLLSTDEFAQMKHGAVLINTARGPVVDIRALLRALGDGRLAAAGLDVLPEEPAIREEAELLRQFFEKEHDLDTLLANHVLLRMRNVIITPHSAFYTREAVERILDTTRANIAAFIAGEPQNLVSRAK